jgi:hypothetical protein
MPDRMAFSLFSSWRTSLQHTSFTQSQMIAGKAIQAELSL